MAPAVPADAAVVNLPKDENAVRRRGGQHAPGVGEPAAPHLVRVVLEDMRRDLTDRNQPQSSNTKQVSEPRKNGEKGGRGGTTKKRERRFLTRRERRVDARCNGRYVTAAVRCEQHVAGEREQQQR